MTPAAFRLLFPAFDEATDTEINAAIALSPPYFNVARWGSFYQQGLSNFVAHEIVIALSDDMSQSANDILAEDRPTLKFTRDSALLNLQAKDPFQRTKYGQKYQSLVRSFVGVGAMVV